jgi:hypothetical protein
MTVLAKVSESGKESPHSASRDLKYSGVHKFMLCISETFLHPHNMVVNVCTFCTTKTKRLNFFKSQIGRDASVQLAS